MTPAEWYALAAKANDADRMPAVLQARDKAVAESEARSRRAAWARAVQQQRKDDEWYAGNRGALQQFAMRDLEEAHRLRRAEARMAEENATGVGGAFLNYVRDKVAPRAAGALASAATMINPFDLANIAVADGVTKHPLSTEYWLDRADPDILKTEEAGDARDASDIAAMVAGAPALARGVGHGVKKIVGPAPLRNMVSMEMASTHPDASYLQQLLVNRKLSRPSRESQTVSRQMLDDMFRQNPDLPRPQATRDAQGAWQEGDGGQWNPAHILYYDAAPTEAGAKAIAKQAKQYGVGYGPVERPVGWRDYVRGPLEALARRGNIKRDPNSYYVPRRGGDAVIDMSRNLRQRGRSLDDVIMVDDPAGGGVFVRPATWNENGSYATSGLEGLAADLPQLRGSPRARLLTDYAGGVE